MVHKVATFEIKVDLNCQKCRNKIKKILCEIPQIQNQLYDEKNNVVVVKVVCCSPDKVKNKICCKGGKTVKGIKLKPDPPPPPPPSPPSPPSPSPPPPPPPPPPPGGVRTCCRECYEGQGGGPCRTTTTRTCCRECYEGRGGGPCRTTTPRMCCRECYEGREGGPCRTTTPRSGPPPSVLVPAGGRTCCKECYEGREGGPCWSMYGRPCFSNESSYVCWRPVYDSCCGGSYVQGTTYGGSRCTDYISDDNPVGCFIM